jgi:membrane-bound metal-dependent hydrolase YbcI (DUF457 family)
MKGIAHFAVGVAAATFFPEVVTAAGQHAAFGPLIGGLAGLLPDTLDFKLFRFLERRDLEIDPVLTPEPKDMAGALAAAAEMAQAAGRTVRLHFHTERLGGDVWRRWKVAFYPEPGEVVVSPGPPVTTGQLPLPAYRAGVSLPEAGEGRAQLTVPILYEHEDEIQVDILSGPSLAFAPAGDAVRVIFLPWHRAWSHSLLAVLLLAAGGWLLAPVYGAVAALAALAHVALDQLGYMGSNLAFPLTRHRTRGLRLFHSGDALPNFLAVWLSGALVLFNLDRFSGEALLPPVPYLLLAVLLPCLACAGLALHSRQRRPPS